MKSGGAHVSTSCYLNPGTDRETDSEIDRETDRETDRDIDRDTDRQKTVRQK